MMTSAVLDGGEDRFRWRRFRREVTGSQIERAGCEAGPHMNPQYPMVGKRLTFTGLQER